jgi:hypothetical protein
VTGGDARDTVAADGLVPAGREAVFGFLARLDGHWRLADRWIEVLDLDADGLGGRVRMRGPLGLSRTAVTRVVRTVPPERIEGTAALGRTLGAVAWTLAADGPGATRVRLEASVLRARALDRLLLAAGGRLWLRRRLAATLGALVALAGSLDASARPGRSVRA